MYYNIISNNMYTSEICFIPSLFHWCQILWYYCYVIHTVTFQKFLGISRLAEELLASQEGLCFGGGLSHNSFN